jgi:hypothetical protein
MTERKRDHIATAAVILAFALAAIASYAPDVLYCLCFMGAISSLPILLWQGIRRIL